MLLRAHHKEQQQPLEGHRLWSSLNHLLHHCFQNLHHQAVTQKTQTFKDINKIDGTSHLVEATQPIENDRNPEYV